MTPSKDNIKVGDVLVNTVVSHLWPVGRTVTVVKIGDHRIYFEGTDDYIHKDHLSSYEFVRTTEQLKAELTETKRILSKEEMIIIKHAVTMLYQIGISPAEAEQIFLNGV